MELKISKIEFCFFRIWLAPVLGDDVLRLFDRVLPAVREHFTIRYREVVGGGLAHLMLRLLSNCASEAPNERAVKTSGPQPRLQRAMPSLEYEHERPPVATCPTLSRLREKSPEGSRRPSSIIPHATAGSPHGVCRS